jgi:hypothetical protein
MSRAALLLAARLNLSIDLVLNVIMTSQPLLPTARAQPSRYQTAVLWDRVLTDDEIKALSAPVLKKVYNDLVLKVWSQ